MNLIPLSTSEWADVGNTLKLLWIAFGLAILGSGSFLLAHAFIPSGIASGSLPAKIARARVVFYLVGLFALLGIIVAIAFATHFAQFISHTYPRRFF